MEDQAFSGWVAAPGEELCLDFTNTRFWRGTATPSETLATPQDLLAWCEAKEQLPPALAASWRASSERATTLLRDALDLREAIYRIFLAMAAQAAPAEPDVAALNRALAEAPARQTLAASADGFGWQVAGVPNTTVTLLTPVLWSAGDLLSGRRLGRLRRCANEQCRWLFLDDSKSGNRRWCSMASCGNRAKAHRHYMKRKRAG